VLSSPRKRGPITSGAVSQPGSCRTACGAGYGSRVSLRSPGTTRKFNCQTTRHPDTRHRPVFIRPQGLPVVFRLSLNPVGAVRNDWRKTLARGARIFIRAPACRFRIGTRAPACRFPKSAYGRCPAFSRKEPRSIWTASDRSFRLRSARGWTLRFAACPQELSLSPTRRLVRADCRPDMHLDRPPDAPAFDRPISAAPGRSIRNPQFSGPAS
jgi:hypothetical protein